MCNILCIALLLSLSGCQRGTVGALMGKWEGRPDTAAARAEREKEKFGTPPTNDAPEQFSNDAPVVTDWEQYDVTVHFDFQSSERIEIALAGNDTIQTGNWRIVASSPTGCTIEVVPDSEEPSTDAEASNVIEPRRFELELDHRDGKCVGFLLSEAGADRQLGALYFRRPTNTP